MYDTKPAPGVLGARERAEALLARAAREGTPLIDGDRVTFVWLGEQAPRLLGDFGPALWVDCEQKLEAAAPGVWTVEVTLAADAYVEYVYLLDGGQVTDPFNSRTVSNGLGGAHHYFYMPGGGPTELARWHRGVARGMVTRVSVDGGHRIASGKRDVYLYQPAAPGPHPLLVVLDGQDYLKRARLTRIVDNLIAQDRIAPLAMALVAHGGHARFLEYAGSESTLAFLTECVLPLARERLNVLEVGATPGVCGIMGASLGGLMAAYAGLRAPEIFGKVLCQSGSFDQMVTGRESVVLDLVRAGRGKTTRFWLDVGRYERLIESNRRLLVQLRMNGYDATLREYNGGHNYPSWRDDVWRGLEALFSRTERGQQHAASD